jgi:hypothetical protein
MDRLHALCPVPLHVVWHDNTRTYLSIKKRGGLLCLRLHRLFLTAPTPVLEAVIQYAMHKEEKAKALIKQMAHLYFSEHTAVAKQGVVQGAVYDLQAILQDMQKILPVPDLTITWARNQGVRNLRSITFGIFDRQRRQIRINRLLDDAGVPLYFLQFIVYHEMLHAVCPSTIDAKGRHCIHTKQFREKEKNFPEFERAQSWAKQSITFFQRKHFYGRS